MYPHLHGLLGKLSCINLLSLYCKVSSHDPFLASLDLATFVKNTLQLYGYCNSVIPTWFPATISSELRTLPICGSRAENCLPSVRCCQIYDQKSRSSWLQILSEPIVKFVVVVPIKESSVDGSDILEMFGDQLQDLPGLP